MKPNLINYIYRIIRYLRRIIILKTSQSISEILFKLNLVKYGNNFKCLGVPIVDIKHPSSMKMGNNVTINNGLNYNRIGRQQKCFFIANYGGVITIGNGVGISGSAIICHLMVTIGNNVIIGGNTVIYDTDFHPINYKDRLVVGDAITALKNPVIIEDNVFIGAHTTILKGVTIGNGSVVGACSVVTKNIPPNEVWAGNPAKHIKNLRYE